MWSTSCLIGCCLKLGYGKPGVCLTESPSTSIIGLLFPLDCYKQNQCVLMTSAINLVILHRATLCTYPVVALTQRNRVYPFHVVNYFKNAETNSKMHLGMFLSLENIGNTSIKHTIKINKYYLLLGFQLQLNEKPWERGNKASIFIKCTRLRFT